MTTESTILSIPDRIRLRWASFTATDKKVARILLADYPVAGLGTLAEISAMASISSPSIIRFVKKLGFNGYPEFQRLLHGEIAEILQEKESATSEKAAINLPNRVRRQQQALLKSINDTFAQLPASELAALAGLLSNQDTPVIVLGGFSSTSLAQSIYRRLIALRPNCELLGSDALARSERLIDLSRGCVLLAVDVQPNDPDLGTFICLARERGAKVAVITDDPTSVLSTNAHHVLLASGRDGAGTSRIAASCLLEVLLSEVIRQIGQPAHDRLRQLAAVRS